MKMHRVRMRALIQEIHSNAIALGRANRRARDLAVVRPGGKKQIRGNLDLTIDGKNVVLAQKRPVWPRRFTIKARALARGQIREIPRAKVGRGIESNRFYSTD